MESEFAVLCSKYHVYKNLWDASVGEELPWEWYAVAVMRRSTIDVGHELSNPGRYQLLARDFWPIAACSLFLADQ